MRQFIKNIVKKLNYYFESFQKSPIGNFLINFVFFRKKGFYSVILILTFIFIEQILALFYGEKWSEFFEKKIITPEYLPKIVWQIFDVFAPSGSWIIIVFLAILLIFLFIIRFKELISNKSIKKISDGNDKILKELKNISSDLSPEKINKIVESSVLEWEKLSETGKPNTAIRLLNALNQKINKSYLGKEIHQKLLLVQSRAYQNAGISSEALRINKNIIKEYPQNINAHLRIADSAKQTGDSKEYEKHLAEAEKIDLHSPDLKSTKLLWEIKEEKIPKIPEKEVWGEENTRARAICYYVKSIATANSEDLELRDKFINKAIANWQENLGYRLTKLEFFVNDFSQSETKNIENLLLLEGQLEELEQECVSDDTNERKLDIMYLKLRIAQLKIKIGFGYNKPFIDQNIEKLVDIITNRESEVIPVLHLRLVLTQVSDEEIHKKILNFLNEKDFPISEELIKLASLGSLKFPKNIEGAKELCKKNRQDNILKLIESFESDVIEDIIQDLTCFTEDEVYWTLLGSIDAKKQIAIFKKLPDSNYPNKKQAMLFALSEREKPEELIKILQEIDVSKEDMILCDLAYNIAIKTGFLKIAKRALIRMLEISPSEKIATQNQARLSYNYYQLKDFKNASLMAQNAIKDLDIFSETTKYELLGILFDSLRRRGKYEEAVRFMEEYKTIQCNFLTTLLKSDICIAVQNFPEAKKFILEGVEKVEHFTDNDYLNVVFRILQISNVKTEESDSTKDEDKKFVKIKDIGWFYIGDKNSLGANKIETDNINYLTLSKSNQGDEISWSGDQYSLSKIERKIEYVVNTYDYLNIRGHEAMSNLADQGSPYIKKIETSDDPIVLMRQIEKATEADKSKKIISEFETGKMPFFMLSNNLRSVGVALSKLNQVKGGYMFINKGTTQDILEKDKYAQDAINGNDIFLDLTSSLLLLECNLLEVVLESFSNLHISNSALNNLHSIAERLKANKGQIDSYNNIKRCIEIIEDKSNTYSISQEEKPGDLLSQELIPEIIDPYIQVKKYPKGIIMTEDMTFPLLYAKTREEDVVPHFSIYNFIRILKTKKKITNEQYYIVINVLSNYRENFLHIESTDIINCIFQKTGAVVLPNSKNIGKLNLEFTYSSKYANDQNVLINVSKVVTEIINDNSINESLLRELIGVVCIPVLKNRNKEVFSKRIMQTVNLLLKESLIIKVVDVENRFLILEKVLTSLK